MGWFWHPVQVPDEQDVVSFEDVYPDDEEDEDDSYAEFEDYWKSSATGVLQEISDLGKLADMNHFVMVVDGKFHMGIGRNLLPYLDIFERRNIH